MSEAVELYKQDGTTAGIFYCSECRVVHRSKDAAEWCHGERLCVCGKKIASRFSNQKQCDDCDRKEWQDKQNKKEWERFDKAKKITEEEYGEDHVFLGDSYYDCVESAIDQFEDGQEPEYVWACKDHGLPKASIDEIIEHALKNMWEDADSSDLSGVDELQAAIDKFNEDNKGIKLWEPDYSTAILVGKV